MYQLCFRSYLFDTMMPSFSDKDFPIVLTGLIDEWKASTWTPDKLSKMLDDVKIKFRIGRKDFAGKFPLQL